MNPHRYHLNEGSFEPPPGWEDDTSNVLTWSVRDSASPLTIVISREVLESRITLADYVDQQVESLSKELQGFQLASRRPIQVAGTAAEQVEYTWLSDDEPVVQRQAYVPLPSTVLTFTATMAEHLTRDGDAVWQKVLGSFGFR